MKKIISTADFEKGEVVLLKTDNYKTLKLAEEYSTEAQKLIYSLPKLENKFYCLVIALGAGEYWGANRNGDYFPEEELKKSYHTFKDGHVFELHKNDNPEKAIGRVIEAFWNDKMKRVELVIEVDKVKGYKYYEKLERGEPVDVSMGCKVEFDVCSICGNKSKTRAEYCDHLKHHMNEILPDGRKIYAINPNPVFFDISFVRRGADPTAKVLLKVAQDKESEEKISEIEKEIPAIATKKISKQEAKRIIEVANAHLESLPEIPEEMLHKLTEQFEPHDILYTLAVLGIPVKLHEFRTIISKYPSTFTDKSFEKILRVAQFVPEIIDFFSPSDMLLRSFYTQNELVNELLPYPADDWYDKYQRIVIIKMSEDNEIEKRIRELNLKKKEIATVLFAIALLIAKFQQIKDDLRVIRYYIGVDKGGVSVDKRWENDLNGMWVTTASDNFNKGIFSTPKNLLEQHGNLLGGIISLDEGLIKL